MWWPLITTVLKKIFSDRNNYTIINFENDEIIKKDVVFSTEKWQ